MIISRLKQNYPNVNVLIKYNLVTDVLQIDLVCKHCGHPNAKENTTIFNEFWKCSNCNRNNKHKLDNERESKYYLISYKKIRQAIIDKLNKFGLNIVSLEEDLFLKFNNYKIPLVLLELNEDSSSIVNFLEVPSIIIYFLESSKSSLENVYTSPYFCSITDFLLLEKNNFITKLNSLTTNLESPIILTIKEKIKTFCKLNEWKRFEKEVSRFFDELKFNEGKIKKMFNYFKENSINPNGTKFVHVGGNYPVDIYSILLFEYLNEMIKVEAEKSYDAKMYQKKITKQTIDNKTNTNKGRKLIFITNQRADSGAWREIIKSKENYDGKWYHFIIDFDLLVLLLYFVGHNKYFN